MTPLERITHIVRNLPDVAGPGTVTRSAVTEDHFWRGCNAGYYASLKPGQMAAAIERGRHD